MSVVSRRTAGRSRSAVTIADVAREAGVAPSTVSYVLNGTRTISSATRRRVLSAVEKLGYRPNAGARALASARTETIALVMPLHLDAAGTGPRADIDVAVLMQFVAGIITAARAAGYDVLLLTQDDPTAVDRVTRGAAADALVLLDVRQQDPRIDAISGSGTPAVLIGLPEDPQGLPCVDFDFEAAGRLTVRHLAESGHRNIALLGPTPTALERHLSYADRLLRGATRQAELAGVHLDAVPTATEPTAIRSALSSLLARDPAVTGVVVHNERALPYVLDLLAQRNLDVPGNLSVVSIGPLALTDRLAANLDTVDVPAYEIGRTAVGMALAALADPDAPAETRLLAPRILRRGSVGAAPTD